MTRLSNSRQSTWSRQSVVSATRSHGSYQPDHQWQPFDGFFGKSSKSQTFPSLSPTVHFRWIMEIRRVYKYDILYIYTNIFLYTSIKNTHTTTAKLGKNRREYLLTRFEIRYSILLLLYENKFESIIYSRGKKRE